MIIDRLAEVSNYSFGIERYSLYCLQKTAKTTNKVMKINCNVESI